MKNFIFNIGADPEFNITMGKNRISAEKLFRTIYAQRDEEKEIPKEMGYEIEKKGNIGWDGANATGEMRPKQENSPEKLCNNIETLLRNFAKKTALFDLTTSSHKAPIGGHIHLEIPEKLEINTERKLVNIHKKMASFCFPILLSEDKINTKIRTKNNYGKITDYKIQEFGGKQTYEFRSPSAEWLTTRKLAMATLAYIGVVYNEIVFNENNFNKTKRDTIIKTQKQAETLQLIAESGLESASNLFLKQIKREIKKFKLYEDYKKEINFILEPKKVKEEKEKYKYNILEGWGILKDTKPTKRDLLSEKRTMKKAKQINLDDNMYQVVQVNYNKDTNVQIFAKKLKQKIIVHNWKLKNTYFLFGLKKGIKDYFVSNEAKDYFIGMEQLKTKKDFRRIENTFNRMSEKIRQTQEINLNNMSLSEKQKIIYVGIPYEERLEENTTKMIKIIYEIEKMEKGKRINVENLSPEEGDIEKLYREEEANGIPGTQNITEQNDSSVDEVIRQEATICCRQCSSTNTERTTSRNGDGRQVLYCHECGHETSI